MGTMRLKKNLKKSPRMINHHHLKRAKRLLLVNLKNLQKSQPRNQLRHLQKRSPNLRFPYDEEEEPEYTPKKKRGPPTKRGEPVAKKRPAPASKAKKSSTKKADTEAKKGTGRTSKRK